MSQQQAGGILQPPLGKSQNRVSRDCPPTKTLWCNKGTQRPAFLQAGRWVSAEFRRKNTTIHSCVCVNRSRETVYRWGWLETGNPIFDEASEQTRNIEAAMTLCRRHRKVYIMTENCISRGKMRGVLCFDDRPAKNQGGAKNPQGTSNIGIILKQKFWLATHGKNPVISQTPIPIPIEKETMTSISRGGMVHNGGI